MIISISQLNDEFRYTIQFKKDNLKLPKLKLKQLERNQSQNSITNRSKETPLSYRIREFKFNNPQDSDPFMPIHRKRANCSGYKKNEILHLIKQQQLNNKQL